MTPGLPDRETGSVALAVLGRGVVVRAGQPAPAPWADAPRVVVDAPVLHRPAEAVHALHAAWVQRRPVVVELGVDAQDLRHQTRCTAAPYALSPDVELWAERLHFLVWANTYDARGGDLVWWHGRKAADRFVEEGVRLGGPADVTLADGMPLFIDGGPPQPPDLGGVAAVHRWNAEAGLLRPAGNRAPTAELAPDQMAAVAHASGPARVIAPAGSGKTRVLTERLRHLLADRRVAPSTVTVVAYNVKAAEELRARCADVVGARHPRISTLNSLGLAICNDFGGAGRHQVFQERDVRDVVESLFQIRHRSNTDTVVPYIEALSTIRMELVSPDVAEEAHPDAAGIAEGFDRYRHALADAGALDYDEQIYRAIEILLTDPAARAEAQRHCRYLLVDEFQDLTPAHLLLIRLLNAPAYDCFGVGDDDQVLYGYSGATPEYLIGYDQYFPGAGAHACEVNYRCPPAVVRAASELLSYNRRRVRKTIRAAPGRADGPGALAVRQAPAEELAAAAVDVVRGWEAAGVGRDDLVVLARVNAALLPVLVALGEAGVPCDSSLTGAVLGRTGLRTAFAYLRMGTAPEQIARRDVEQTIRRPSRGVAPNVVAMLTARSYTSVTDIRRLAGRLSGRDGPKLAAYADDIERVARACPAGTAAALRTIRVELRLGETMEVLDGSRDEPDRSSHNDDLQALESVAAYHPDPGTFQGWLREVLERPRDDGPAVLLSTVHRIKGREWSRVVVFGASAGLFPHRLSDDVEGERRVFHVALTRARDEVVVLADAATPSFFLAELDGSRPRPEGGPAAGGVSGWASGRGARAAGARAAAAKGAAGDVGGRSSADGSGPARAGRREQDAGPVERTEASAGLRAWRAEEARRQGVPAYVVLSDRYLEGIVAAAPTTLAELARCKGIGPMKLERWGDQILAVLQAGGEGTG